MSRACVLPPREAIGPETPLRLAVAAALAFPDGSVTASTLRSERDRGRLEVERIAGKEFTTLGAIERMRERCRVKAKDPVSTSTAATENGSSATDSDRAALAALKAIAQERRKPSPPISRKSTSRHSAMVIPLGSRS